MIKQVIATCNDAGKTVSKKLRSLMSVKSFALAAVVAVAGVAGVFFTTQSFARDCTANSIIKCGTYSIGEFNTKYAANETGDLPQIYNYLGIDVSKINRAQEGYVTPQGQVVLKSGNRVVANGVQTVGRNASANGKAVKLSNYGYNVNTTIYVRSDTSRYNASLEALVVLKDDGSFDYAILKECANPVVHYKEKNPGISITKKVDNVDYKKVNVNQVFDYQISVKNTGDVTLNPVNVRDVAPDNVQFLSTNAGSIKDNIWSYTTTLAPGETKSAVIKAKVTKEVAGKIVNTACVDTPLVPNNPNEHNSDDCDDATVEVPPTPTPKPGVDIEKTVNGKDSDVIALNTDFTYELVVKNTGETDLTNVAVTDKAPAGVTFTKADKGDIKDNAWSYTIPTLKKGASEKFVITAKVTEYKTNSIVNTACVDTPDVPGTPDDCDEVPVTPPPVTPTIEVCDLTTKKVVTIKESDFDSTKYSKNLDDCKETPVTPETPAELPKTGINEGIMAVVGLGSIIAATAYYVASRRSI